MKRRKVLSIILSLILIIGAAVTFTLAYLQDQTESVVNTFTAGDITITLTESDATDTDSDNLADSNTYQMVPGCTIAKDPTVTVEANSGACYVFVKLEETRVSGDTSFGDFLEYTVDTNWTLVPNTTNVYYKAFSTGVKSDQVLPVLKDNQVTVKDTVTESMMDVLDGKEPQLKATAYIIQYNAADSAEAAWEKVEQ